MEEERVCFGRGGGGREGAQLGQTMAINPIILYRIDGKGD
jgi:hypothetical protein